MATSSNLHYILIPDTQALFVWKDRTDEVNPTFTKLLAECRQHCVVDLVIPETVRGEIIYQKAREIQTAARRLRDGLENLTALTGHKTEALPSDAEFRTKIEAKFDAWLKANGAIVAPNVINAEVWTKIIDDAIWRVPPFEHSDDGRHEKGFRDSLIKTSVIALARAKKGRTCAFVSDDNLLKQAIDTENIENLKTFESLKMFAGHVSLVRDTIDQKLAIALQANAQKTFYEEKNPNCVYFRDKVAERIQSQFNLQLQIPAGQNTALGSLPKISPMSPLSLVTWSRVGQEKIWLKGTTFAGRPKPNSFMWKSRLLYTGLFQPSNAYMVPQLRKTMFEVTWTSQIKDAEITNPQLVEPIALIDSQFALTTPDEAKQYGFDLPPPRPMDWTTALGTFAENIQQIQAAKSKSSLSIKPPPS